MKKFKDTSGWIRAAVCCTVLVMQYGIRDSLLTALPIMAADRESSPEDNDTMSSLLLLDIDGIDASTSLQRMDDNRQLKPEVLSLGIYGQGKGEFKVLFLPNKSPDVDSVTTKLQDKSRAGLDSDTISDDDSGEMAGKNTDSLRHVFPSLSAFWEKLNGRNVRLQLGNARGKSVESSISRLGKHSRFFPTDSDVSERDENVFQRSWMGEEEWEEEKRREDESEFIMDTDFSIPLMASSYGENSTLGLLKEDWSVMAEGLVLSSVYWGWLITTSLSDVIITKLGVNLVMTLSVGTGGLLGILTHAMSLGGPWVLLPFRIILGAAQGLCYPAVTRALQGVPESSRMAVASVVFLGPSVGSCLGAGLGSLESWYISTYVLGSLAVPLVPLCLMLPKAEANSGKSVPLSSMLKNGGVWACLSVYVANTFTLHTILVGLPFCLAYTSIDRPWTSGWVLISILLVVALLVRLATVLSPVLGGKGPLTVLNRRRLPVVIGSLLMLIAVIVMATAGLGEFGVTVGLAAGGVGIGSALTRISCKLNLEDLAPWTLPRLMHVVNTAGVFTAVWPPLLVAGFAQTDEEDSWLAIWLIPLALIVPSAVVYVFLLTTNPQPWDEPPEGAKGMGVPNGLGPPTGGGGPDAPAARGVRMSFKSARSGLSFKSAKSSQTFKTAMSRRRSRTTSCRTVDEDLSVDMRSVIEDGDEEVHSIAESNQECKSVASTISFKSEGADMQSIDLNDPPTEEEQQRRQAAMLEGSHSDRTSAWLNYHHHVPLGGGGPSSSSNISPPTKAQMRKRNAIYELFW